MPTVDEPRFSAFRRDDLPLSHPYEILKLLIFVWFLPLRVLMIVTWVLLYSAISHVSMLGNPDPFRPLSPFYRWFVSGFLHTIPYFFRFTHLFLAVFGFYNIKIVGDNSLTSPEGVRANICVANHSCYVDMLMMMHAMPEVPSFLAKAATKNVPLFGTLSGVWQCVFVERREGKRTEGEKAQAAGGATKAGAAAGRGGSVASSHSSSSERKHSSLRELLKERAMDSRLPPIVIFPEGTTTNNRCLMDFKNGAFQPGQPVKPVIIKYPHKYFGLSWESVTFPYHLLRMMCQFVNHCEIHFLPVYCPSEEEIADPTLYAENVQKMMAEYMQVPIVKCSIKDKFDYLDLIRGTKFSDE
eukprot:TRINITY_DN6248_c0_g1_i1.p1 TRINITY_DN6248_c0_g1~~TRINITY_DN6248_c0_g1_i1.p1  ORF type:complete len:355 (+),score=70.95 TRINITY_DN6248_c0_g1_i1:190-1254(+)